MVQPKACVDLLTILPYSRVFCHYKRMQTIQSPADNAALPSSMRLATTFAILFAAYQLPEGLGMRLLNSFAIAAALIVLFLPVAWLCGRRLGYQGLDAWFMSFSPRWAVLLGSCFALSLLVKAAALWIGATAGIYHVAPLPGIGGAAVLIAFVGMLPYTFFPSVAEDIVTRGFLMRAAPALAQRPVFIVASAGLFVLNHIYRLSNGPLEWLMIFCFGLAYAAALFYSRTLWAAIGLHWGWNFAGQFADRVASVDAVVPWQAPLLSSLAHLAMLGVVVLVARRFRRAP